MIEDLISGNSPVWMRAVMVREGDDIVTRCCVVTQGQLLPIEVRVNIPKLIAAMRALGMDRQFAGQDAVSGFGSFLKKAAKTITHNKIVKAVGKVASKVVHNPVAQFAFPGVALGLHNASVLTGGKGILPGPIGDIVNAGVKTTASVVLPGVGPKAIEATQKLGKAIRSGQSPLSALPSIGLGALDFVAPKAAAALGVGLKTVLSASAAGNIAAAAKTAQQQVALGKAAAQSLAAGKVDPKRAMPLVQAALATRAKVQALAPALARQVVASNQVKASLATIAAKAKAGSPDAKLAASVIAKSQKALDAVKKVQVQAAGGTPGLLITSDGRIVKAPKGRFMLRTSTTARPDLLYRGPRDPVMKGSFSAVSGYGDAREKFSAYVDRSALKPGDKVKFGLWQHGRVVQRTGIVESTDGNSLTVRVAKANGHDAALHRIYSEQVKAVKVGGHASWGGDDDPGNELDGPLYPITHEGGRVLLDDLGDRDPGWLTP